MKHIRYYLVVKNNSVDYRKIESELPFSTQEGINYIKENKDVIDVKSISKEKAKLFLKL